MNIIVEKNAMAIFNKRQKWAQTLGYFRQGLFTKKKKSPLIDVVEFETQNYLGYKKCKSKHFAKDLLFTRTFLKDLKKYRSPGVARTLISIAQDDFSYGNKLRQEGDMKSVILPDTSQQKVLLFCLLSDEEIPNSAYILVGVKDAKEWYSHGKKRSRNYGFQNIAKSRQRYYTPIYKNGLITLGR